MPHFILGVYGDIMMLLKYFGNEFPAIIRCKRFFDFVARLCFYECLELLKLLKTISFGFQWIQLHPSQTTINETYKIPCIAYRCGPLGATYIGMHNFERLGCSPPCLLWKCNPLLFTFDTHFTRQRACGGIYFNNVHNTHHVLESMNILHVQMVTTVVPNSNALCFIGYCTKLATSISYTFTKFISYITIFVNLGFFGILRQWQI